MNLGGGKSGDGGIIVNFSPFENKACMYKHNFSAVNSLYLLVFPITALPSAVNSVTIFESFLSVV